VAFFCCFGLLPEKSENLCCLESGCPDDDDGGLFCMETKSSINAHTASTVSSDDLILVTMETSQFNKTPIVVVSGTNIVLAVMSLPQRLVDKNG